MPVAACCTAGAAGIVATKVKEQTRRKELFDRDGKMLMLKMEAAKIGDGLGRR